MRNVHTTKAGKPKCILERCRQPVTFIDETDTGWCAMHWRKYDMMMAGAELEYPPLPIRDDLWGPVIEIIEPGWENWLNFVIFAPNSLCNKAWRSLDIDLQVSISNRDREGG